MLENTPYPTQFIMYMNYKNLIQDANLSLINGGVFLTDNGGSSSQH